MSLKLELFALKLPGGLFYIKKIIYTAVTIYKYLLSDCIIQHDINVQYNELYNTYGVKILERDLL